MAAAKKIKLTLLRSFFGRGHAHRACVMGLGLRRRHHTVVVDDTPANRGMVDKIAYMLKIEEA